MIINLNVSTAKPDVWWLCWWHPPPPSPPPPLPQWYWYILASTLVIVYFLYSLLLKQIHLIPQNVYTCYKPYGACICVVNRGASGVNRITAWQRSDLIWSQRSISLLTKAKQYLIHGFHAQTADIKWQMECAFFSLTIDVMRELCSELLWVDEKYALGKHCLSAWDKNMIINYLKWDSPSAAERASCQRLLLVWLRCIDRDMSQTSGGCQSSD